VGDRKTVGLWRIFAIFWTMLFIVLSISLYFGLTSTYAWYTERTSQSNYLTILYVSILMFASTSVFLVLQTRRIRHRMMLSQGIQDVNTDFHRETRLSWLAALPLLAMICLNLIISVIAVLTLRSHLMPNYQINTVLILLSGSSTKISMGLLVAFLFRVGLVRQDYLGT